MRKHLSKALALTLAMSSLASVSLAEGSVLNVWCWNDEFQSRFNAYYPEVKEVAEDKSTTTLNDGTIVKWTINPNADNNYQNKLDEALLSQESAADDDKIGIFKTHMYSPLPFRSDTLKLLWREVPPRAGLELSELQRALAYSFKAQHLEADRFAHFSDLTVAPLVDRDLKLRAARKQTAQADLRTVDNIAVKLHRLSQVLHRKADILALDACEVGLIHIVRRVHHVVCKVPVVCHKQQPLGIHI